LRFITYILHKNYRLSSSVKLWIQRKFTSAGGLVFVSALLMGGIGIDTNQALAYQAFALLVLILFVSFVSSLVPAPKLKAQRILPRVGTAEQPLHYKASVFNPSRSTQASLTVTEDLADPRPTFQEFADTPEPGERRRNYFDRFFRFYRWMWLIERNQLARAYPAKLPPIAPGKAVDGNLRVVAKKRGHLRLRGLQFAVTDPFGLCWRYSKVSAPQSVLILPKRYVLPPLLLGGASQYQPGGISLASSVGESEEFLSVREYRRGDPLRHIHWKSTGRTGKLIVKEFQNEYFMRHALVLDTFLEDSSSPAFEEAVSIAASFAYTLNTQESLLDLLFVGAEAVSVTAGHGVAQVDHMLEILAAVQPCTRHRFEALVEVVLRQIGLVSGCVCIFLKWDENRKSLVDQMSILGIPMLVLVLKKPGAKDPKIELKNDRFVRCQVIDSGKVAEDLAKL
jgi:uncharacterized protein (DUF58 family)